LEINFIQQLVAYEKIPNGVPRTLLCGGSDLMTATAVASCPWTPDQAQ